MMKYLGWIISLIFIAIFILFYNFKYLPTETDLIKQTDENTMWQSQIEELKKTSKPAAFKAVYTHDDLFANPTSFNLSPNGESILIALKPQLTVSTSEIMVSGYTDNSKVIPALRSKYPTNWELSSARAIAIVKYLEKIGIKSERLVALGYGETRPVADNTTEEGRKQNRRIEITVRNQ